MRGSDRLKDAIPEYQKVIELRPKHFAAHLLLGRAQALSGDPPDALPNLIKAAELQPRSPEPHRFLADAYIQLGRKRTRIASALKPSAPSRQTRRH